MNRSEFLKLATGTAISMAVPRFAWAQQQEAPNLKTFTYKTVGNLEIKADVYGADDAVRKPVLMWIHGGALIQGSRKSINRTFQPKVLENGFVLVSIEYRLAPETKLPAIIEDVRDAHHWIRESGPKLFNIDPERLVVAGESAGGYLTLMTAFCVKPRPQAIVSYYGYGDIIGPWYSRPSEYYLTLPAVAKEEADSGVGTAPITEPPGTPARGHFYIYCRQHGLWPKEVAGHDPDTEARWFHKYCPIQNVSRKYAPAFLVHGTADTDVPYEESKNMTEKLQQVGVEHKFITVPGAGHGLKGASKEETTRIADEAMEFVKAHTS